LVKTSDSHTGFRKRVSGVPRDEMRNGKKEYIGGPKFVCTNQNSCGDNRH